MLNLDEKVKAQEEIIDEIFQSVLKKQPKNIAFIHGYLFKKIEEIFELEVNYLGLNYDRYKNKDNEITIEYEKYDPKENQLGGFNYSCKPLKVTLYTEHHYYYEILSDNPKVRIQGVKKYLNVLFHELRHLKQYLLIQQNVSNKNVLRNAKEFLVLKSNKKLYRSNHGDFAIEADARIKASNKVNELTSSDYFPADDFFDIIINESKRDYNEIVFNDKIYNRDTFNSYFVDRLIKNDSEKCINEMPILLKEYNYDGSKRNISNLIFNMKKEIEQANLLEDENNRNEIIDDIKELYYELIYNRIKEKDIFELYDAILSNSQQEVIVLINDIADYFKKERRRKIKLLRNKYDAEEEKENLKDSKDKRYVKYNNGSIKYNVNKNIEVMDPNEYAQMLLFEEKNPILVSLYKSKGFIQSIPNFGYYLLNNNTRISVSSFARNIFLKEYYNKPSNDRNIIPYQYSEVVAKYAKSRYEMDFINKCSIINRSAQNHENILNDTLDLSILSQENIDVDYELYSFFKIIKDIDKQEVLDEICDYMNVYPEYKNQNIDYSFTEEQQKYFIMLDKTARLLNNNTLFNPHKIDYYSKYRKNETIKYINSVLKKYNRFNILKR